MSEKIRIVLAKAGLDGHDQGINIVKDFLIEEGFEVFYFGIYNDSKDISEIAVQEGVDFVGLSIHSGAHLEYVKEVCDYLRLRDAGSIGLVVGGIIPEEDEKILKEKFGVRKVFVSGTPNAGLSEIKKFFSELKTSGAPAMISLHSKFDVGLIISAVANRETWAVDLVKRLPKEKALTIGVTGPLGAGKSTLIDKLVSEFHGRGKKVGVITVDPSDPVSGGALLGRDRTQMRRHLYDDDVYIYSMASRGFPGGIARSVSEAAIVLKSAGCEIIIIETIGVGQDQTAVKSIVDKTVLVLTPDVGEDQVYKSGLTQIADLYAVNKSDIMISEILEIHLNKMIEQKLIRFPNFQKPLVFKTAASKENDNGIKELVDALLRSA